MNKNLSINLKGLNFLDDNITTEEGKKYLQYYNINNLFYNAAINNKINIVKALINKVDLSKYDKFFLITIVKNNYIEVLKIILDNNNINVIINGDNVILRHAIYKNNIEMVKLLLQYPKITSVNLSDRLKYALETGCYEIAELLMPHVKRQQEEYTKQKIIEQQIYEKKIKKIKNYLLYLLKFKWCCVCKYKYINDD